MGFMSALPNWPQEGPYMGFMSALSELIPSMSPKWVSPWVS